MPAINSSDGRPAHVFLRKEIMGLEASCHEKFTSSP